jgi:hypothetical protein
MSLEREVARVEETNRRAGNVAFERLGTPRQKEGIVLSPYGQETWFVRPKVILESWVECDVALLMSGLCGEEPLDENCGVVRILFREEVATLHRLPLRVRSPMPPNAQWTAIFCIESVERAMLGP